MKDCCPVSFPVCTDACKIAGGAFHQGDFVYKAWSAYKVSLPINYLEVLALEAAVCRWAPLWRNNVAACAIINKGTCRDRTVMDSLRRIFWLSAIFNFRLKCIYYPGDRNKQASSENLCPRHFLWKVSLKILNSGIFLKTCTHDSTKILNLFSLENMTLSSSYIQISCDKHILNAQG